MLLKDARFGGYSFPSMGRIHLGPDLATEGVATGATPDPVEPGGTVDAGDRTPVTQPASNSNGVRDFAADVTPQGGQGQVGPATPADPNAAAGAGYTSIRDAAKTYGYQFDKEYEDDASAFQALVNQAQANRQADYYAQLGRNLAPHAEKIKGYLSQQQPQAQAPAARPAWEAPEFDERWLAGLTQDEQTGFFVAKQGFPAEFAQKANEYLEWKRGYDRNPTAIINQMIEAKSKELFNTQFEERTRQETTRNAISSIVRENSAWFEAKDANGQTIYGPNGYAKPSPLGAAYIKHLGSVRQSGVTDPGMQDRLAKQLLQGDLDRAQILQYQQATQQATPGARQAAYAPSQNALGNGGLTPSQQTITPGASPSSMEGLSLSETLRRQFAAEGITDADFASMPI